MTTSTVPGRSGSHRFTARLHRAAAPPADAVLPAAIPTGRTLAEAGEAALEMASAVASRIGVIVLRYSLAMVFIWFGALKIAGVSPVYNLIGATLPWFNPAVVVPMLGGLEVLLGVALLVPRARRVVLVTLVGHLCGTFLSFITASSWMWSGADPLRLTASGEFVLKNLVLISAVLVLLGSTRAATRARDAD